MKSLPLAHEPPESWQAAGARAFTIIELLVVVSIIALLVGILLPAIGKARDQAQLTRSNANVKQLGTAAVSYAAEFSDRQFTAVNDNLSRYGADAPGAFANYAAQTGNNHPWLYVGYGRNTAGQGVVWGFDPPPDGGNTTPLLPIDFEGPGAGFGSFRLPNARPFSTYLNGRFYDPVFYAPKDTQVYNSVEPVFDNPDEFVNLGPTQHKWSSYCFSPAAMLSPAVLGKHPMGNFYWSDPWDIDAGFRCPGMSQAAYGDLKTHIIEHNWCQNRKKPCHPGFSGGPYDSCTPFFFNHAFNSQPVSLFYDGHVETTSQQDAMDANSRVAEQTNPSHGLWSIHTPFGGSYADNSSGGYFMDLSQDWTSTSYHILTIDGIKGRDLVAK